jgi:adenylate cyclase
VTRADIAAEPDGRKRKRRRRIVVTVTVILLAALVILPPAITYWRIPELAPAPIGAAILYVKEGYLGRQILPTRPTIAVLPFKGRGDANAKDYADAISEGTASTLSMVSEMRVVPQLSVLAAIGEGRSSSPGAIAATLGVRYLLDGEVLKSGNAVRTTITLIDTKNDDSRALTETFESNGTDFLILHRAITLEIITALQANLTGGEQERINRAHSTQNIDAWLAAAQAEKLLRRLAPDTNLTARHFYERAIALDATYTGAWDGLAWTYLLESRFAWTSDRAAALEKADQLAQKALALNENRPQTFSLLGSLRLAHGDHAQAIAYGEQAVRLEANDADAAALLAYSYTYAGQPERALALVERAIRLRPYPPEWYLWLKGRAERQAGRYEDAIRTLTPGDTGSPSLFHLVELAAAFAAAGEPQKAKAISARIVESVPGFSSAGWASLVPYGDPSDAEQETALLKQAGLPD